MRFLLLLLIALPVAAAEPSVTPSVVLGTSALLANEIALGVAFSPGSEEVLLIEPEGTRAWSLATGKPTASRPIADLVNTLRLHVASDGRGFAYTRNVNEKYQIVSRDFEQGGSKVYPVNQSGLPALYSESCRFAALSGSGSAKILDLSDGTDVIEFPGVLSIRRFSASNDGRSFAFCNQDGEVSVHTQGQPVWVPKPGKRQRFSAVALSADGKLAAFAEFFEDDSGRKAAAGIVIYSVAERKIVATCDPCEWFAEFPNRLRFTPDGRMLLAGDGAYLRGWNTTDGSLRFAVEPGWNYPGAIVISPNSQFVAVSYGKRAMVWDINTGKAPRGFEGHAGPVWEMTFTNDGSQVATTSYGLTQVMIWQTRDGRLKSDLLCRYAGTVAKIARVDTPTTSTAPFMPPSGSVTPGRIRAQFAPDGQRLATLNEATGAMGPLRVWDVKTGHMLWHTPLTDPFAPDLAFVPPGLLVAHSPRAVLADAATGKPIWTSDDPMTSLSIKLNRRGDRAVLEDKSGWKNPVIDTATGKVLHRVDGIPHAFSADGRSVVAIRVGPNMTGGTFHDAVVQYDLAGGKETEIGKVTMGEAVGKLSPDGELRFVSFQSENSNDIRHGFEFREVAGNRLISTGQRASQNNFQGENTPRATAFSRDNRLFAAVYAAGTLTVWDVASGQSLLTVDNAAQAAKFVAFSPDGRTVFTASGEGGGGPVFGFDTTGRGAVPNLRGNAAQARRAIEVEAARGDQAVALARTILSTCTAEQVRQSETWIDALTAPVYADREAAVKGLAELGWRVEDRLRKSLATTASEEARERLTALLAERDMRPLRAVHLLELIASDAAKKELSKLAEQKPETYLTREARRALERISPP